MAEIIDRTFTVTSPARLTLSNIRGSVEIRPGGETAIHITAIKRLNIGDAERTEVELSQDSDGTVVVNTRFPEGAWSWLYGSFPCPVDYVVEVPRKCILKANAVSSEIHASGIEGEFSFQTVSGELTLSLLTGPVKVNTVSGNVELADLTGNLSLKTISGKITGRRIRGVVLLDTVSGKISLEQSDLTSIIARTVSGAMTYQTAFGEGPYHFNSVSGNVELLVPAETQCTAEMQAVSGKLTTKIPTTYTSRQNGTQTMQVQGGGVKVTLQSISGNLSLAS